MQLYNTITRKIEEFKPVKQGQVGIYSCGPTVYWNQHIGHMYAYTQWDCLVRTFKYLGFGVKWVMNITDVGHLTSDEDSGEDKMEKGSQRENKSVWDIADQYITQFNQSLELLNIQKPDVMCRATEHISEQIALIKKIEKNGFTYKTQTGLVLDTGKFAGYADFGRLNLNEQKPGFRVEVDPQKKKPWDFLLWVTNQPNHIMQWDSPWGRGFPGWHIECTAMSVNYLGESFDIHTGGKEHISIHHTNEVAQAFAAFGHQTANFWLHNEWLTFEGEKISKSSGNSILVPDLVSQGFSPLALRYLILTSHYRSGLNFSLESLTAAQTALTRLKTKFKEWEKEKKETAGFSAKALDFEANFKQALENDLQLPQALAVVWSLAEDSQIPNFEKYALLKHWDRVLGLKLEEDMLTTEIPPEVEKLAQKRKELRDSGDFAQADKLRIEIGNLGFLVEDTPTGHLLKQK